MASEIMPITLERQIIAVNREIRMREHTYPRWVGKGKMKQEEADEELNVMRAVLNTLQVLQKAKRYEDLAQVMR